MQPADWIEIEIHSGAPRRSIDRSSHRGQSHHEARAEDARTLVLRHAHAVLGADAPAMRFDDLAGDRKTEAGVLPEALMRPVGIEAFEDALHRFRRDTRAVVIYRDLDRIAEPIGRDAHPAVLRRELARVLDQIVDDLSEA